MKKKFLIFLLFLLPIAVFAQNTGLTSLESDFSYGLFPSTLDMVINVGEDFFDVDTKHFFGGVANLHKLIGNPLLPFAGPVMWTGLFLPGTTSLSIFQGLYFEAPGIDGEDSTAYVAGPADVYTLNGVDYTHNWNNIQTETNEINPLFQQFYSGTQVLLNLGDNLNIGGYININLVNDAISSENRTITVTDFYDADLALPTTAPNPTVDSVTTTEYKDLLNVNTHLVNNTIALGLPVFLKTGSLAHTINAVVSYNWTDGSSGYFGGENAIVAQTFPQSYADPATAFPFGVTDTITNLATRKNTELGVDLDYTLELPGIIGNKDDNTLSLMAGVELGILDGTYLFQNTTQNMNITANNTTTLLARNDDSYEAQITPNFELNAELGAAHSFYFNVGGAAEFAIEPNLLLTFDATQNNRSLAQTVTINRIDVNTDGAFDNVLDTITTTTVTYSDSVLAGNGTTVSAKISTTSFDISVSVPSSLRFQPEKLPFGFILSGNPAISATFISATTKSTTVSTTTGVVDGTGTAVGNDTQTVSTGSDPTTTKTFSYNVGIDHSLGVFMDINQNVHLSIDISAAVRSGIWDFTNLIIQATISLP